MTSRLLIAGNSRVGKKTFLSNLQDFVKKKNQTSAEDDLTLHLETKYYSADVKIDVCTLPDNFSADSCRPVFEKTYEGIIFVINRNDRSTFVNVCDAMRSIGEDFKPDISLMIVSSSSTISGNSACATAELESFCLENCMELIDIDGEGKSTLNGDDTQCRGLSRVLEALQSTMWTSMQKIVPKTKDEKSIVSASESLKDDTDALDGGLEAFESLLLQVQQVRENGSKVSHEIRRRDAEQVAIKLWNLLGCEDD
uniref:AlNc14C693G12406 protein n=1 Tax=Albugo laibachii Nc14 TaxID=890382 RepID=F0X1U4_9STRA|nr:AlNc14C693G12406 [Albugo laibachii Nc14]|eukprot:CCA27798.1 AlNc14C693G12406 [Albugo laibachii Nc14]